jgi:hypothetical protein
MSDSGRLRIEVKERLHGLGPATHGVGVVSGSCRGLRPQRDLAALPG